VDYHVFVLHHTDERGRKRRLLRRFREVGMQDVEWVETFHPRDRDSWGVETLVAGGSIGETSCELKHRDALRRQVDRGIPMAVILEDDVELPDRFADDLPGWLDEFRALDGDILMIGTCYDMHVEHTQPGRSVYEAPTPHGRCTHAYAVPLGAARVFAEGLRHIEKGIGHDLNDIVQREGMRMCWVEPGIRQLTMAGEMLSAISERQTNEERRAIRRRRLLAPLRAILERRRAARHLRVQRAGDARPQDFFSQFVGPGDLTFDVGANDGDRTRVLRSLGARVVSVEPQPGCVRKLERAFGADRDVVVVGKALAASEGTAELRQNEAAVLASLSPDFIAATERSGRFAQWSRWAETIQVETTTLDQLIDDYGRPRFCKIDVEGFELEVLRGLSHALPVVSIEYTAEAHEILVGCVERLRELGSTRFAYSPAETFELWQAGWVGAEELIAGLDALGDSRAWGDVYAAAE
jgi:FkbM family methyltransferase